MKRISRAKEFSKRVPAISAALDVSIEDNLSGYFAEYDALRTEIGWLLNGATQYQNFAIALIGPYIALLAWVIDKAPNLILPALLTAPFVFSLLGFLYIRQHEEVFVIAAYLSEYIRPRIRALVKDDALWGWEEFKAERNTQIAKANRLGIFTTSTAVLILRALLFLVPGLLPLIAGIGLVITQGFDNFLKSNTLLSNILIIAAGVLDCLVVLLLIIYMVTQGNLPKRILRFRDMSKPHRK